MHDELSLYCIEPLEKVQYCLYLGSTMRLWRRRREGRIASTGDRSNNGTHNDANATTCNSTTQEAQPSTSMTNSVNSKAGAPSLSSIRLTPALDGHPLPKAHDENSFLVRVPPASSRGGTFFVIQLPNRERLRLPYPTGSMNVRNDGLSRIVPPAPSQEQRHLHEVDVPSNVRPGEEFRALVHPHTIQQRKVTIRCPPEAIPGQRLRFRVPPLHLDKQLRLLYSPQCRHWKLPLWRRQIRASDGKFQWMPTDDDDARTTFRNCAKETKETTLFAEHNCYYVRQLTILEGREPRLRTGRIDLVPVDHGSVPSLLIIRNQLLVKYSHVAEIGSKSFRDREQWVRSVYQQMSDHTSTARILLRRSQILSDSVGAIMAMDRHDLRKQWEITIMEDQHNGDNALKDTTDATVLREKNMNDWFDFMEQAVFGRDSGLFQPAALQPGMIEAPLDICPENNDLVMFRFVGRFVGRALLDNRPLHCRLVPRLFRHILGWPIPPNDVQPLYEQLDHALSERLVISDLRRLCFSFLQTEEYLLPQLTEVLLGIFDVVPEPTLTFFHPFELETMLCRVNVEEWRSRTRYMGEYYEDGENNPTVQWFWEILGQEYDDTRLKRLIEFVSGYEGIPLQEIFRRQSKQSNSHSESSAKFTVRGLPPKHYPYPRGNPSLFRLELPMYDSKDALRKTLNLSIDTMDLFDME